MRQVRLLNKLLPDITAVPEIVMSDYFNSLDGLRAISILIVIVGHLNFRWNVSWLEDLFAGGHLGVCIFFVISGFLITTLLLKERILSGTISLKQFYIRRTFRIFPVAYLYLLIIIPIGYWYGINISFVAIVTAILYLRNFSFTGPGSWYVNHYWSLAIEEQFYLLFPVIIKWNIRRYTIILLSFLACIILSRLIETRTTIFFNHKWVFDFLNRGLEGILIGSLFSIAMFQNRIPFQFLKKWNTWINIFLALLIVGVHNNLFNTWIMHILPSFLSDTILYILIALLILNNLSHNNSIFFKLLNNKVIIHLGLMSYSLYIWQQFFTINNEMAPGASGLPWYSIPLNLILLLCVSLISYKYFEQPIRRLRQRFEARNKSGL